MSESLLSERELAFQLYEVMDTEALLSRPRYREHSRETFDSTLETARRIAQKYFANHNRKGDANEPVFDGSSVTLVPETKQAWDAFADAGFLAAHHDFDQGGMQLPEVVLRSAMAYFNAANIATTAYPFLSIGAANLIDSCASRSLKARFLPPMLSGRFSGTMALTEPDQGSALADIRTTAVRADDGSYRIVGQKMYISGGDHELTDNIVHLVLAKIKGAPAGVKGISLFIVPKFLVNDEGEVGERNDVALAGLLHKMGYRNTTSTVLNFGEQGGAVGFLVGEPHQGLKYMFQMMNEARIGVALGAAALGYQGFLYSTEYARKRPQGRPPSSKDPLTPQVPIIQHADVRRMLLMQKSFAEGALALCLYASSLFEDQYTAGSYAERERAATLLDLLIPVVKSWPSRYCVQANEIAVQVLGGAGYTREYPVEQYYRDNRLNPIHEGTEGIHGLDLLGRKLVMNRQSGFGILKDEMRATIEAANGCRDLDGLAAAVKQALETLEVVNAALLPEIRKDADRGLANATIYLDLFGRVVVAWVWLRQAVTASRAIGSADPGGADYAFYRGKLQAARYYIEWELPQINSQAQLLKGQNSCWFDMQEAWF